MHGQSTYQLPHDPVLAGIAAALNDAGYWADIVDRNWRWVFTTDALRLTSGSRLELEPYPIGESYLGPKHVSAYLKWRDGRNTLEPLRDLLAGLGPWMLADTPGGHDQLREVVDPRLHEIVDELSPAERTPALMFIMHGMYAGRTPVEVPVTAIPVRDTEGQLVGTLIMYKPAASMAVLGTMASAGDLRHFERMQQVAKAGRRPAAVLFADLEASSPLTRRLSTASYFALGRRMARVADQCVIDAEGLVGRHVGDGVVAFFLAETAGSESAAARACIEAARALKSTMTELAASSELAPEDLIMRFGLHWGATLYVGQIATSGRAEVTALGDEVNEGARIEACATGGRALASKELLERLDPDDAAALDLDPDRVTYTPLADLPTATDKARRDAPAIAVCEV